MEEHYVSITGLSLRRPLYAPVFWWHALRSMAEAQRAEGNLAATARTIDGAHYTLSLWTDFRSMRAYLRTPRHAAAARAFPRIATGRTLGFPGSELPDWDEAIRRLNADGRVFD